MTSAFMMKHKSEAFYFFKEWKILVESQTGKKVKRFQTNNGLEICSAEFNELCKEEHITRQYTVRNTPQKNGVAERMNITFWKELVVCFQMPG